MLALTFAEESDRLSGMIAVITIPWWAWFVAAPVVLIVAVLVIAGADDDTLPQYPDHPSSYGSGH